ncbi:MAG: response regulator [Proteobacteria bacterium]|nr:response regulator [Pseudomonadota bacterium]
MKPLIGDAKRVLIAEDDDAMRTMLATALEKSGFHVDQSRNGEELIERLCTAGGCHEFPAVIVSDVVMPGMSGLDALAIIRLIAPQLPVVLLTAFGDRRTHQRAIQLGAGAILDKPFDLRRLNDLVGELATTGGGPTPPLPQRRSGPKGAQSADHESRNV